MKFYCYVVIHTFYVGLFAIFFDIKSLSNDKKIAFVKQVVYQDLYCASSDEAIADIIFSSFLRSGPVALFTRFNTDFYIVEVESDEECSLWRETTLQNTECKFKLSSLEGQYKKIPPGRIYPQGFYTVKCDEIDWSMYDIVIAVNCAVPARITQKYPSVLWAYYIGEHTTPSHAKSFTRLINGYDVFLTQDFFAKRQLQSHVIEFPYQLQYYGCFHELFKQTMSKQVKNKIYFETWSSKSLLPCQKEKIAKAVGLKKIPSQTSETLREFVLNLINSKYLIIFLGSKSSRSILRGNCIPEAIAAGCLVIAQKNTIFNKDLLSARTLIGSFEDLLQTLKFFEKHPEEYAFEVALQREKLNQLCFYRPVQQLFAKHDEKRRKVSVTQKIS